jgi:hypothetical protein
LALVFSPCADNPAAIITRTAINPASRFNIEVIPPKYYNIS